MLEDTMIMSRVLYGGTDGFKLLRHSLEEVAWRDVRAATPHVLCLSSIARSYISSPRMRHDTRDPRSV